MTALDQHVQQGFHITPSSMFLQVFKVWCLSSIAETICFCCVGPPPPLPAEFAYCYEQPNIEKIIYIYLSLFHSMVFLICFKIPGAVSNFFKIKGVYLWTKFFASVWDMDNSLAHIIRFLYSSWSFSLLFEESEVACFMLPLCTNLYYCEDSIQLYWTVKLHS